MTFKKPTTLFFGLATLSLAVAIFGCGSGNSSSDLTGISISPLSQTILVGDTLQYKATGHFRNGPDQDLTINAKWSSSQLAIATINNVTSPVGLATGVSPGQTTITVSFAQGSSSVAASTDLTVDAP